VFSRNEIEKKLITSLYSTHQGLSFFPKSRAKSQTLFNTSEDSEIYRSSFYYPEKLEMQEFNPNQTNLKKYFN
jgi:Zn-dependent oligopeptidase